MSLKLISLASGSKGNCTLILSDKTAVLLDAGISYSRIAESLKEFGLSVSSLDGVVITHEHSDHVSGLLKLSKECKVFAHPLTAKAIYLSFGDLKNVQDVDNFENGFFIGDIYVEPFRIPHDAVYPLAYSFSAGEARCSVATDMGVPTRGLMRNIQDSDVVLLESNHDVTMLKEGKYPFLLKERILSDKGHLSNDSAAKVARLLAKDSSVKHILLGHISENNNTERLALETVQKALDEFYGESGESDDERIRLYVAHQRERSEVLEIL